jgi:transcriptional regulator with XRE-family HTH domain
MNEQESIRLGIAVRLKLARAMAGLTQGQVAIQLGWHRPTVSEVEAGRRRVLAEELKALSELYGVNVPWLIGDAEDDGISDRAKLAARQLDKLSDEDLDRLLLLIRALKS